MTLPRIDVLLDTDSGRGNQTGESLETSPESLYNPGYADNGNAPTRDGSISIDAQPDLAQPAKTTLGNYLSNATRGQVYKSRANTFTLPEGSSSTEGDAYSVSENASTHTSPGQAAEQIRSAGTTLGTFLDLTKGLNSDASTNFTNTKNSDYGGGDNPFVETDIKKVGSVERSKGSDGHTLLPGIRGRSPDSYGVVDLGNPQNIRPVPETAPIVQQKISEVLRQNRFNAIERAFVQNHQRQVKGGYTVQRTMGQYNPNAPEVNEDKLLGVAQQLMVRATGHAVPGIDLFSFSDPQLLTNLVPLVPSLTQATGLPIVNSINLEAKNVQITDAEVPQRSEYTDKEFSEFKLFAGNSYGALNSDLEPFSDPFPIGTITATVGSFLSFILLSFSIAGLIRLGSPSSNLAAGSRLTDTPRRPQDLRMGSSNAEEDEGFLLELLNIPRTDFDWGDCFFVGLTQFLGVDLEEEDIAREVGPLGETGSIRLNPGEIAKQFLKALLEFVLAPPGYYAGIFRSAARSVERIINAGAEIAEVLSSSTGADVTGAAARLYSLIGTITESAAWRFTMSMVVVGNQILFSQRRAFDELSERDLTGDTPKPSQLHKRSRIRDNNQSGSTQRTAFSQMIRVNNNLSMYVLPQSFRNASDIAAPGKAGLTVNRDATTAKFLLGNESTNTSRFSPELVKSMELTLDAEYVPFYFHDLRTNEIISFFAFLSELSDGFSANYNASQGYGRADEVMVYGSTKRSMSLTFFLAATSEDDHNKMYWDINKLVSMVYPQYSRGRALQSGDLKFVQPFSQLPTASPMIRLRVGDVVKGNYSRFGIARLFGLGRDAEIFNGDRPRSPAAQTPPSGPTQAQRDQYLANTLQAARNEGFDVDQKVTITSANPRGYIYRNLAGAAYTQRNRTNNSRARFDRPAVYTADPECIIVAKNVDPPPAPARTRPGRRANNTPTEPPTELARTVYTVKLLNPPPGLNQEFIYHRVYHSSIVGFTENEEVRIRNSTPNPETGGGTTSTNNGQPSSTDRDPQKLLEFLGSNTLIKSFETTGGKGLAGFITDLKFDWGQSTWETAKDGSKAPIYMSVSISFSPIHDIPMGLDSDGMMRSVAYGVGNASNALGSDTYRRPSPNQSGNQPSTSAATGASSAGSSTTG